LAAPRPVPEWPCPRGNFPRPGHFLAGERPQQARGRAARIILTTKFSLATISPMVLHRSHFRFSASPEMEMTPTSRDYGSARNANLCSNGSATGMRTSPADARSAATTRRCTVDTRGAYAIRQFYAAVARGCDRVLDLKVLVKSWTLTHRNSLALDPEPNHDGTFRSDAR
jgi:hypothetical protein